MSMITAVKQVGQIAAVLGMVLAGLLGTSTESAAALPQQVKALYLPSHCFTERKISEFIHYAGLAGLNAAVLHVKDPHGWVRWKSNNQLARETGALATNGLVEPALKRLKARGIWTIAKLDVFVDHRLVSRHPEMGIRNTVTGAQWLDKNGLGWANPFNPKVWDYNIALCRELVDLGFDEIQFDYIRFPSDGDLAAIEYPVRLDHLSKTACIGRFLESARSALKPSGIIISVDLFGLVAWKTVDFGVGQLIESIAPHVDVICPMLYPSHFPVGFLGKQCPGDSPLEIMELSLKRLQKRTRKRLRPWIQGFWYSPEQINAQWNGLERAHTTSWSVWNPSGNYSTTYGALAQRLNQNFAEPRFYPSIGEIGQRHQRIIPGESRVVNLTDYREGYTIISLEEAKNRPAYSTLIQVLGTIDEGILDQILTTRRIPFTRLTGTYVKKLKIAELVCQDLQIDPHILRPKPIYIRWRDSCRFTRSIPNEYLHDYQAAGEALFAENHNIYAIRPQLPSFRN